MFQFITTEDGSPSMRLATADGTSEAMHSLRGAYSETLYIYGTAIQMMLDHNCTPRVLSMGLGLGYVELLSASKLVHLSGAGGESFEIVPELRDYFTAWALDSGEIPDDFRRTYDEILSLTAKGENLEPATVKEAFADMLRSGRWIISDALTPETMITSPFGCICFDAFSSKTTPDVWTEEFLNAFLKSAAAPSCVLSTYACTGALKRSLKSANFELRIREGFASKRDCTLALRLVPLSGAVLIDA